MKGHFEKVLIMPFVLTMTPTIALLDPTPQQQQAVGGIIRWSSPEWSKVEYSKVQSAFDSIKSTSGMEIEEFVLKVAEVLEKILPDRNFSITLGTFAIEYKPKKKGG